MSYYENISGIDYDRCLLDITRRKVQGRGDGRISKDDTVDIIDAIKDKNKITKTEFLTLLYITHNFNFTTKSFHFLSQSLADSTLFN